MDISISLWNQAPVATAAHAQGSRIKESATGRAEPLPAQPRTTNPPTGSEADAAQKRPVNALDLFREWLRPFAGDPETAAFLGESQAGLALAGLDLHWPPSPDQLDEVLTALGLQPRAGAPAQSAADFVPAVLPKPAQIMIDRLVRATGPWVEPGDLPLLAKPPVPEAAPGNATDAIKAYQAGETHPSVLPRPYQQEPWQPVPQPVPRPTSGQLSVDGPVASAGSRDDQNIDPEVLQGLRPVSVAVKPAPAPREAPAIVPRPFSVPAFSGGTPKPAADGGVALPRPDPWTGTESTQPAPAIGQPVSAARRLPEPEASPSGKVVPAVLPKPVSGAERSESKDHVHPAPGAGLADEVAQPAVLPRTAMVKTVPRPGTQTPVATATLVAKKEGSHDDIVTGKPVAVAVAPPAPEVLPSPVASERPERPEILPRAVAESVHRQVADRIGDLLATRAPSRVLIRLEPADLGTILLDVRSFGGRNEATVTVSDDAVRQALAANRAELVQAIEARGLNLSQFSVSPDGSAAGQHRPDQTVMQDAVRTAQLAAANVRNDPAGPAAQLRPRLTAVDFMA